MSSYVAVKVSQSVYNEYFGVFDSLDETWNWINSKDPRRQQTWSVIYISDKESN